jgi:hypothetical protein
MLTDSQSMVRSVFEDVYNYMKSGQLMRQVINKTSDATAYIDVNPEHDMGTMPFAETVAVNRAVNVRLFSQIRSFAFLYGSREIHKSTTQRP